MAQGHVEHRGIRLWYDVLGPSDGAAVMLVMGVGASSLWWPRELTSALVSAGFRVVLFDNRDIGLSTHVDYERAPYGLSDMALDTTQLMDALGIASAHLVGMSLGGMIAQLIALEAPERVLSLALISSTPGPDERLSPPTAAFLELVSRPPDLSLSALEQQLAFCRAFVGPRFPFDEPFYRSLIAADIARGTNLNSSQGRVPMSAGSRLDSLPRIAAPTLVVHGGQDPLFPPEHAQALARGIGSAQLVSWEGVGHELPPPLVPELTRLLVQHLVRASD
ncbi:MAG: alpha/beta hydrolase [Myxococcales bacterium]|nr:MAG: alpha/beta hydrolase [Myxococcales bacterium]